MIPVRFNPSNYSVMEGVDSNAVITLEALVAHPFDFSVTVLTQNGSALRESCHHLYTSFHFLLECVDQIPYVGTVQKSHPSLHFFHILSHYLYSMLVKTHYWL